MASPVGTSEKQEVQPLPIDDEDMPLLYEDEEKGEMGSKRNCTVSAARTPRPRTPE